MHYKHGDARKGQVSRLHNIWRGMLKRCNPKANRHARERYADRGITVCPEWQSYLAFKQWALASGYSDHLTLERRDNNGPYSPGNCRWATFGEQCRNRRTTRWVTARGETKALSAWLAQTGVRSSAFHARLKRGWPIERALGL